MPTSPNDLFEMPKDPNLSKKTNSDNSKYQDALNEEKEMVQSKSGNLLFVGLIILFSAIVGLIFFFTALLKRGIADSLLFIQIGFGTKEISTFLAAVANISFTIILLVLLILTLYELIKAIFRKSTNIRRYAFIKFISGSLVFVIFATMWFLVLATLDPLVRGDLNTGRGRIIATLHDSPKIIDPINLEAPTTIDFSFSGLLDEKASRYKVVGYLWDLEGKNTFDSGKSGSDVTWTYNVKPKNPNFEVSLKLKLEENSSKQIVEEIYKIPVSIAYAKPVADVVLSTNQGVVPLSVDFNAESSYDSDGQIIDFVWDMNADGQFDDAKGPKVNYIFKTPGDHLVRMKIVSDDGRDTLWETRIKVEDKVMIYSPVIDFERKGNTLEYVFDATKTDPKSGTITQYLWMFDGLNFKNEKNGQKVSVVFPAPGDYNVTLVVKGKEGEEKIEQKLEITDKGLPPKAVIDMRAIEGQLEDKVNFFNANLPLKISVSAAKSEDKDGNIVSYKWDLDGDGKIDLEGSSGEYSYSLPGTYTLSLTVTDSIGFFDTVTKTLVVTKEPFNVYVDAKPQSGNAPLIVDFDASGSNYENGNIAKFRWDFGDGSTPVIADAKIRKSFENPGIYKVKITAIANDGKSASKDVQIVVGTVPLSVTFTSTQIKGVAPLAVSFFSTISGQSNGSVSYEWDFGDGIKSSDVNPSHTFTSKGTFPVTLRVKTPSGTVSDFTSEIVVE